MSKEIEVIYVGRREFGGEAIGFVFKDGDKERSWSKLKGSHLVVGHRYKATRDGDSARINRTPEWIGQAELDEDTLNEWHAMDAVVEQRIRREKARRKFMKDTPLRRAVRELRPLVKNLHFTDLKYFSEWMAHELRKVGDD